MGHGVGSLTAAGVEHDVLVRLLIRALCAKVSGRELGVSVKGFCAGFAAREDVPAKGFVAAVLLVLVAANGLA